MILIVWEDTQAKKLRGIYYMVDAKEAHTHLETLRGCGPVGDWCIARIIENAS